ncbi:MAG: hypothetical protein JWO05_525 [Gemmatimonadetes bacterium]|nr:hypothetical protein [Gemmatimonadota bacterium]
MTSLKPLGRFLTLLFAALQFAAPALVSVADGAAERSGVSASSHVEALGGSHCPATHTAECALCGFLSMALGNPRTPVQVAQFAAPRQAFSSQEHRPVFGSRRVARSRAPPVIEG